MKSEALCIKNLSKKLNEGYELKSVSLRTFENEILGIFGHNDSGILALSGILSGRISYDEGQISVFERIIEKNNANELIKAGVYHITSIPKLHVYFTVAESICTTFPPVLHKRWITHKMMMKEAGDVLTRYHVNIDPGEKIYQLTAYEKTMVEILRMVIKNGKILILENLFYPYDRNTYKTYSHLLKTLAREGKSIVIIRTDLRMSSDILDRLIIIDEGKVQGVFHKNMFDAVNINSLLHYDRQNLEKSDDTKKDSRRILELKNVEILGCNIDYAYVKKGEVVGFINASGDSFNPMTNLLNGTEKYKGDICLDGKSIYLRSQYESVKNGIGFITKYDDKQMLFNNLTIGDNILIMKFHDYSKLGFIDQRWCSFVLREYLAEYKMPSGFSKLMPSQVDSYTRSFIPRIKWEVAKPKIIVISNPFSGMDPLMRFAAYEYIDRLKKRGVSFVVCISTEEGLVNICDRIYIVDTVQ